MITSETKDDFPLVSVIIPTYGGSISLSRAIDSVLIQEYPNYNIIVVDDNDPGTEAREKTELMMEKYKQEPKVIYLQHKHNKNGAAARNTGAFYSDAKYLCLLDDDDVFLQNRISKQVVFLEKNTSFDACYCWRNQYGKDVCGTYSGDLSKVLLDLTFTPTTSAIMITKKSYEILNGFDESYQRHQDYEFLLRFFKDFKIGVVPEILLMFIGNEQDNQVYGKKLYALKETFFKQFEKSIIDIDNKNKGYKKRVYAAHFSSAVTQLLRKGNFFLALKMYFFYGTKGGLLFWKMLISKIVSGVYRKINSKFVID